MVGSRLFQIKLIYMLRFYKTYFVSDYSFMGMVILIYNLFSALLYDVKPLPHNPFSILTLTRRKYREIKNINK